MVTKLRRNDGKRFTAPKSETTNQPTVFTMLAKLERAKNEPPRQEPPASKATPSVEGTNTTFTDVDTGDNTGWTIVVANPKKQKKPFVEPVVVPEILFEDNETETMVPEAGKAHYWPIDIKIRLRDNEVVNVQTLLSCILNTFQANDVHTVIVPVDYQHHYDVEHFTTKSTLIPAGEKDLRRYLTNIRTFKESIIIQAIFMTKSLFYQLVANRQPYYTEINVDVRLNWLQADATAVAGFFIRIVAKQETMFDHQCRVQRTILEEGSSPPIQLAIFDLHYHQGKGKKAKEYKTRVYSVRAKEEDVYEVTHQLHAACTDSQAYHFVPWDEYTCLEEEDKIGIIHGQNQFLKDYSQITIQGFDREFPGATMWMQPRTDQQPKEESNQTTSTKEDTTATPIPMCVDTAPTVSAATDTARLAESIQGITANWDEDNTNASDINQSPTVETSSTNPATSEVPQDTMMREATKVPRTPPKQQRTDREDKRRCIGPSNTEITIEFEAVVSDCRYSLTVTEFLSSVRSGDGKMLFDTVFDNIHGRREVLCHTRKVKEAHAFIRVVHREIARNMNDTARELLYPDQTPQNPASCHNTTEWNGFTLLSSSNRKGFPTLPVPKTESTSTSNFEYRTDGRKYYTGQAHLQSSTTSTRQGATSNSSFISTITTIKPENYMRRHYAPVYGGQSSIASYPTRPPSLDETVSSSTITDSSSDTMISSLRHDLAKMRSLHQQLAAEVVVLTKQQGTDLQSSSQQMPPSALAQFERHLLAQTEQLVTRSVTASHRELETKIEQQSTQTETSFQQALGQATAVMKHELDASKSMYTDTLSALKDMMIAQQQVQQQLQQQMQQQQQQMQEQQAQNIEIHRTMMDRLTNTDQSLSIMQHTASLYTAQTSLLSTQTPDKSQHVTQSQTSSISDTAIRINSTGITATAPPSSDAPYPPLPTSRQTQTLLTTGTNGAITLSSCNKNKGQSSRPNGGSTKNS